MGNEKVLIIEDNELNMKLVRSLLQLGKYRVFEADNAEKGLQLMRANRPDLVLMDIQLPGMNGLKATQIIKKDNDLKHTPVVALTSYAMQGDEKKSRQCRLRRLYYQTDRHPQFSGSNSKIY